MIEEKRDLIEDQIKSILFNMDAEKRPRVFGKRDEQRCHPLPTILDLDAGQVALAMWRGSPGSGHKEPRVRRGWRGQPRPARDVGTARDLLSARRSSARLPAQHLDRGAGRHPRHGRHRLPLHGARGMPTANTATFTPDGRRGRALDRPGAVHRPSTHVFANLGDGTYFHSGLLAIRASVAAGVNITYKLLYNDAVAMTGGQQVDGELDRAADRAPAGRRGRQALVIVTDEPEKYCRRADFAAGRRRSNTAAI